VYLVRREPDHRGELLHRGARAHHDLLPERALRRGDRAHEARRPIGELHHERESVGLEHRLDRVEVAVVQPAQHHEAIARGRRPLARQHQLRDELVGAGAVEHPDPREVQHGDGAGGEGVELPLDQEADRRTHGPRDQVRLRHAGGGGEGRGEVEGRHGVASRRGITMCICAPGKAASPVRSARSSSHGGMIGAIRAVPLRMVSLPSTLLT